MSCQNAEYVCHHCLKKLETIDLPKKPISCKHLEDVCEKCLEKVQTSTEEEEEEEEEEEYSPPPLTAVKKRNKILFNSAVLIATGYATSITAELLFKLFDVGWIAFFNILKTIKAPTE